LSIICRHGTTHTMNALVTCQSFVDMARHTQWMH